MFTDNKISEFISSFKKINLKIKTKYGHCINIAFFNLTNKLCQ